MSKTKRISPQAPGFEIAFKNVHFPFFFQAKVHCVVGKPAFCLKYNDTASVPGRHPHALMLHSHPTHMKHLEREFCQDKFLRRFKLTRVALIALHQYLSNWVILKGQSYGHITLMSSSEAQFALTCFKILLLMLPTVKWGMDRLDGQRPDFYGKTGPMG